jgi:hypothetical protein
MFLAEIEVADDGLRVLRPVFQKWIDLIDEYCAGGQDAPYWHYENGNVSFLAGAVWRCGGMALAQYSTERRHTRRGWDWWYGNTDYLIETKWLPFELGEGSEPVSKPDLEEIRKRYGLSLAAVDDIIYDARRDGRVRRLGMVFLLPKVRVKGRGPLSPQAKVQVYGRIMGLVSAVRSSVPSCGALVSVFPGALPSFESQGVRYLCPGVILLAGMLPGR